MDDALDRICEVSYKPNDESSSEQYMQHSSHYDDYSSLPSALAFEGVDAVVAENDKATSVKGKLAYEQIFEVYDAENTSAPKVLSRAYYYDKRDRIIQTVTQYPEGIFCRTSVKYDYVGNPLATVEHYNYADDSTLTIRTDRTFDDRSRQLTEQTSINGEVVSNAAFSYDELGRMKCLELGDNVSINTSYNLQGWISAINSNKSGLLSNGVAFIENLFDEQLKYYNPTSSTSTPYYSGKISEQIWDRGNAINTKQGFQYTYDNMGRLTDAQTLSIPGQTLFLLNNHREQITYDNNSNIVQLKDSRGLSSTTRNYSLQGNKISNITINNEEKGACLYDERGNMTQNVEAGLQFSYNLCNLPTQITAEDGTLVKYSYFADGAKFKAVDAAGNGFVYTGSLRWHVQGGEITPESVVITGGRALYDDIEELWSANYYICDHLGSVRVVTDAEGNILDTYDYMPYGRELIADTDNITDYRFTGKEKQTAFGESNIYDSFARFQNTTGRFMSIDPKAESFYHISPYSYCAGDPVNLVDPDGEVVDVVWDVCNIITGAHSFAKNISAGNYKTAIIDAGGILLDTAAAVIPGIPGGAGAAIKAARIGTKAVSKYSDDAVQLAIKGARSGKLRKALDLKPGSGDAHHIIPVQLLNEEDVVKSAVTEGFDFNGAINGIEVMQHHGSHKNYTEAIRDRIKKWEEKNKNYSHEDAKDFIEKLTTEFRDEIFEYKKLK